MVLTEDLALQAMRLYSKGLTQDKIGKELEISKGRVGKLIREGILSVDNNDENPDVGSDGQIKNDQEKKLDPKDNPPLVEYDDKYFNEVLEKTFLVKATPILRKVALNPRIFFYYDYASKVIGWDGDIGDFLVECVEDYWKQKGFSIRVSFDEEML